MGFINIPNPCPGIMDHINQRLNIMVRGGHLDLPDFSKAESVICVSDYAGEDAKKTGRKRRKYQVLSFNILDWNNAGTWDLARLALRIKKLDLKRTMEFKKLNKDRERARLLTEFLGCFDSLNGLVVTYLIHNGIRHLFSDKPVAGYLAENGIGRWKEHIAEKLLRACHLQAPFVFKLTSARNKFYWLTDRDAITKDMKGLEKVFRGVFNMYATHGFQACGCGEPFEDPTMAFDDLLSVPDLVAGSVLEFVENWEEANRLGKGCLLQDKTNEILVWHANRESSLKKVICRIYPDPTGFRKLVEFGGFQEK